MLHPLSALDFYVTRHGDQLGGTAFWTGASSVYRHCGSPSCWQRISVPAFVLSIQYNTIVLLRYFRPLLAVGPNNHGIMPRLSHSSSRTASPSRFSSGNSSKRQSRLVIQDLQSPRMPSLGNIAQRSRRGSVASRRSYSASAEDLTLRRRSFLNSNTIAPKATDIKRWDGNRRTTSNWDCLRRVSCRLTQSTGYKSTRKLTMFPGP